MKIAFDMVRKEVAKLNVFVQERLNGISIIQSFAKEKEEAFKFQAINGRHRDAHLKTVWHFSVFLPIIELFSSLTLGIIIYYAGIFNPKEISAGELVAFVSFTQMMFRPIRQIADKVNQIQHGIVASGRVLKLMDRKPELVFNGKLTQPIKGKLDFEHIDFSYNDKEQVLKDVSFSIHAGEKLGVVGETGAGKSSIVSLLMQNYKWNKGDIRLDDRSITAYDLDYLKQKMAYAQQDVFLFDDTIWENITMGQAISRETVAQAIQDLNLEGFINEQPQGLQTSVGEKGNTLSAGEKQLVAFLRIYLRNPQLLVLDEATSSIDSITEQYVQTAIAKMTEGRTSIIIAHRLSTLSLCDKIMVMTKGEVENIGTHQELIQKSEAYKKLYQMQFDMRK